VLPLRGLLALTARVWQLEHDPNAPLPESLVKAIALSKRKEAEQVAQDILSAIFQTVTGGPLVFPAKPTPVRRALAQAQPCSSRRNDEGRARRPSAAAVPA
jgi:hypothetical protein